MYELPKLDRILTAEDFEPWVGKMFEAETDPQPVKLQLFRIDRRPAARILIRQPFSLYFRTPANVLLVDGNYRLRCGRFGPHEVFLVPIMSPPGDRVYESVFN